MLSLDTEFNASDLEVALMFFKESNKDIVLECPLSTDIPYLRRGVARIMGEPDASCIGDFKYNGRYILFRSFCFRPTHIEGYDSDQLFYVGWTGDELGDDIKLLKSEGYDMDSLYDFLGVEAWKAMGLSTLDIAYALKHDGVNSESIIDLLAYKGLLPQHESACVRNGRDV